MEEPRGSDDVARGLLARLHLSRLQERYGDRAAAAAFTFVNGGLTIGLLAALAHVVGSPFVFPSLGPTAFLLFYRPLAESASPRNTLYGHAIGTAVGFASLAVFGLVDAGPALQSEVTWPRVGAAALSLAGTSGLMVLLRAAHPPAGATTLIVALGIIDEPGQLAVLMVAVLLLVLQATIINHLAGLPYRWRTDR